MLSHERIWSAIDALAGHYGYSPSGLARKAGLDPTTFNRSKRTGPDGRLRWPSTESIAKVLDATGAPIEEFVSFVTGGAGRAPHRMIPLLGLAQASLGDYFDEAGLPAGGGWDEVAFPELGDDQAYALEIIGDAMLPMYRDGDIVVVAPAATVRRGDRVVLRTTSGEVMAKELKRRTARTIELRALNHDQPDRVLPTREVAWMARIMWASQ
jgi:phage repressor protein C with HTH and peptisase S24 domain